jgi:hypothetical protein
LRGGYVIGRIELTKEPLADPIGREATGITRTSGRTLSIFIRCGLNPRELSVTLYHEVLEAMTLAVTRPPRLMKGFNEGDFERAAQKMHDQLGQVSPRKLNRMLQLHNFRAR